MKNVISEPVKIKQSTSKTLQLNNGENIPMIGLGTSGIRDQEEMTQTIQNAYDAGYWMIDSAIAYKNEHLIGKALEQLDIPRSYFYLITKIPSSEVNEENARSLILQSLENFRTDYLDLVLLHWPGFKSKEERLAVWRVLESLVRESKILSIGVSNFLPLHLNSILDHCEIKPVVNQFELHPLFVDEETIKFCRDRSILVMAYSGFAKFDEKLIKSDTLIDLAEKHKKKPSQILMRWLGQNDFISIPKSTKRERIFENVDIDDFALSEEDVKSLFALNCNYKVISKWNPVSVTY